MLTYLGFFYLIVIYQIIYFFTTQNFTKKKKKLFKLDLWSSYNSVFISPFIIHESVIKFYLDSQVLPHLE